MSIITSSSDEKRLVFDELYNPKYPFSHQFPPMSVKTTGPVRSNYAVEVMDADSETPMQPSEKIT
jgi:hypothetical protein